jgi:hypothetical protein
MTPPSLRTAGIVLIVVTGLIHLVEAPEYFEAATYLGLLFAANVVGSAASAFGIARGLEWGWLLGFLVAGGAFVAYVVSRTVGLPGLEDEVGEWAEPLGLASLIVEGLFVAAFVARSRSAART